MPSAGRATCMHTPAHEHAHPSTHPPPRDSGLRVRCTLTSPGVDSGRDNGGQPTKRRNRSLTPQTHRPLDRCTKVHRVFERPPEARKTLGPSSTLPVSDQPEQPNQGDYSTDPRLKLADTHRFPRVRPYSKDGNPSHRKPRGHTSTRSVSLTHSVG